MLSESVARGWLAYLSCAVLAGFARAGEPLERDVVVYGGTSAAIAAAVQVHRMGRTVVVVSPDRHLGGLSSGGLGFSDTGDKSVIGGIAREFYQRVWTHYQRDEAWVWQRREEYGGRGQGTAAVDGAARTQWIFEPHVAEAVFEELVRECELDVRRDEWLDRERGVELVEGALRSITTLSGQTYRARVFIDATYEGDLLGAAGVSFTVGREPNSRYGETLNGVQSAHADKHQFPAGIDPYVVVGDPSSGLLPRIHAGGPGAEGEGDARVQAYTYRLCLTRVPQNREPFPKPDGYEPFEYELLLRTLLAGSRHIQGKFDAIPNAKTDTNNHGCFSTDDIGANYDYPEADYARRREILAEHRRYQQGYLWFLANDPRVPEDVREWVGAWGLARDEFVDSAHWPQQIYVREARRMVSDFVVTEGHVRCSRPTPRPVGMGSYNMDSHHTQRYVDAAGQVRNEGDVEVSPGGPYPIDYGALVPAAGECPNLLVPVCVSASHIAYGSIRMEPVFLILGQSAGSAAVLCLEREVAVQDLDYAALRARLLQDGQVLESPRVAASATAAGPPAVSLDSLPGRVVDDAQLELAVGWVQSSVTTPHVGTGYHHDDQGRSGELKARFVASDLAPGRYEVLVAYPPHPNRASNVPVLVHCAEGDLPRRIDQRVHPGGLFRSLGVFPIAHEAWVEVSNAGTDGYVVIDAVQWIPR